MRGTEKSEDWILSQINSFDQSIFDQGESVFSPEEFENDEQRVGVSSDHLMLFMD